MTRPLEGDVSKGAIAFDKYPMKEASLTQGQYSIFLFSWQISVQILDQTPSGAAYIFI